MSSKFDAKIGVGKSRFRGSISPKIGPDPRKHPWLGPLGGKGGGEPPSRAIGGSEERKKRRKEVGR